MSTLKILNFVRHFSYALFIELAALALIASAGLWLGGYRLQAVQSGSMTPTFRVGDAVIVKHIIVERLKPGDVISFASSEKKGAIVSHRIKRLLSQQKLLVTQGDNLSQPDTPISYKAVRGQVVAVAPRVGYLIDVAHQPLGIVAVGICCLVLIGHECYRFGKERSHTTYRLTAYKLQS